MIFTIKTEDGVIHTVSAADITEALDKVMIKYGKTKDDYLKETNIRILNIEKEHKI